MNSIPERSSPYRSIPNALTAFRLLAAPLLAFLLLLPGASSSWFPLALFILAAITDFFDGAIARRYDLTSPLGAMLDPIADKAMIIIALAMLGARSGLDFWFAVPMVIILFREVFVSGLREYLGQASSGLKVTPLAKWKTTIQMIAVGTLLAPIAAVQGIGLVLLWIAATITCWTGVTYYLEAGKWLRKKEARNGA